MKLAWEQDHWTQLVAKGENCHRYRIFAVNPLSETNDDIILQQYAVGSVIREQRFNGCVIETAKQRAQEWEESQ